MTSAALARALALAALLATGAVAVAHLEPDDGLSAAAPELTVRIAAPAAGDPGELARRWLEPVEERIAALGSVEASRGEVTANAATLHLRLRASADVAAEQARLQVELGSLGSRLPLGATVSVGSERQGDDLLAVVWLRGVRRGEASAADSTDRGAEQAALALQRVRGVSEVELIGASREELAVELSPQAPRDEAFTAAVQRVVATAAAAGPLGVATGNGRLLAVAAVDPPREAEAFAALAVPVGEQVVPLGTLARVRLRRAPLLSAARLEGIPAIALLVRRDPQRPALAVDRELRRAVAALPPVLGAELGWSAADSLRTLLGWLGVALALTVVAGVGAGAWLAGRRGALALGLAPLVALSAVAALWWLAALPLHLDDLVVAWLGVALALPAAARWVLGKGGPRGSNVVDSQAQSPPAVRRVVSSIAAAALVPLAVALSPAAVHAAWSGPARSFWLALAAAATAAMLLPHAGRTRGVALPALARALRDPGSALLLTGTVIAALTAVCGAALLPRERPQPGAADLLAEVTLPAGTALGDTARRVDEIEHELRAVAGVRGTWSTIDGDRALVRVRLAAGALHGRGLSRLLRVAGSRLGERATLRAVATPVADTALDDGPTRVGGLALLAPEADVDGYRFGVLLRSRDLLALETAQDRMRAQLGKEQRVRDGWIEAGPRSGRRLRLVPRPDADPARLPELAAALRRHAAPAAPVSLRGEPARVVVVVPGAPPDAAHPPQASELLRAPLLLAAGAIAPASFFAASEEPLWARVDRQDGRFVLPFAIRVPYGSRDVRLDARRNWERTLSLVPLPAGAELVQPDLDPLRVRWPAARLRRIAAAAGLPLLVLALGALVLGGVAPALAALPPLLLAALVAAPAAVLGQGSADGLATLSLLAALGSGIGSRIGWTRLWRDARPAVAYAAARREIPAVLAGSLLAGAALLAAGFAPLLPWVAGGGDRLAWGLPLRVAGVAAVVAPLAAVALVPALLVGVRGWLRARSPAARLEREPLAWRGGAPSQLVVRSLGKRYLVEHQRTVSAGGARPARRSGAVLRALDGVSFVLEPGITGLLGPNGAGKTTLLRLLTGILEPSRGQIAFAGVSVVAANRAAFRRHIGYLPQGFDAYPGFTAEQFLDHWARERGLRDAGARREEIARLLAAVGLAEHAGRKVRDFSGGMRQRVGIARALLGAPPMLVVDEPTTGLDLESRQRFRDALLAIATDRVILFSTHIASDVEAVASRILLLDGGRLRFDGEPTALVARARGRVFEAVVEDAELGEVTHRYRVTSRVRELAGVRLRAVVAPGEPLPGPAVEPTLEEAYLAELRG